MYQKIVYFLQNPFVIISTVLIGLSIGFYSPSLGLLLEPFGFAFMSLLEMSLIPIIVCAVILSISNLFSFKHPKIKLGNILGVLISITILVSFLATLMAIVLNPAVDFLESESLTIKEISTFSSFVDRKIAQPVFVADKGSVSKFLEASVPRNIFDALAESKMLQVILFSIIFGIATAYMMAPQRKKIEAFFETTLSVFKKIISAITIWLPIAIIALMAGGAGRIGFDMLVQMGGFILKIYFIFFVIFIVCTIIIQVKTKRSFFEVIHLMKDPIIIAFGTRSSILPIPSILDIFEKEFKIDKSLSKLLVPLGAVLGRFGNIVYFAFLAVFVAGIYQTEMTFSIFIIVGLLSLLAGLSTAGATGILTLVALSIVLTPLHLPVGAIMPLIIAIDAIIDPMRTLTSVYTNCAAVVLVTPKTESDVPKLSKT